MNMIFHNGLSSASLKIDQLLKMSNHSHHNFTWQSLLYQYSLFEGQFKDFALIEVNPPPKKKKIDSEALN